MLGMNPIGSEAVAAAPDDGWAPLIGQPADWTPVPYEDS